MSETQYVRKLATAAAVSLALASSGAFGLGLGDIEMRSALNQPMQAEIQLTAVKPGELEGIIVQLASPDAFARAGIERSPALTDLVFSVDETGPVPVIRISSRRPVVEPFLNFLLEVDWPQGRMIREYTVLLDPPVFMSPNATDRNTAGDQPALVQRGDGALVVPTPIQRDGGQGEVELFESENSEFDDGEIVSLDADDVSQGFGTDSSSANFRGEVVPLTDLSAPVAGSGESEEFDGFEVEVFGGSDEVSNDLAGFTDSDGSTVVSLESLRGSGGGEGSVSVNQGDTLYEIAQSNAVGGASVQQMMMALLRANESSFINNNINLVKAGANLQLPSASEATSISQAQALAAINEQNQLWRDYRDSLQAGSSSGSRIASSSSNSASSLDSVDEFPTVELFSENDGLSDSTTDLFDGNGDDALAREELKLVTANNDPLSTTASATADETANSGDGALSEINRKLQLSQEESSSQRLEVIELEDQLADIENTGENLDALVTLREDGLANLEQQLADARANGEEGDVIIENIEGGVGDSTVDLLADASDSTVEILDSGSNALLDSGETLETVELFSEDQSQNLQNTTTVQAPVAAPPPAKTAWYQNLLSEPLKLLIIGVGGLALLGGIGTWLWSRRRRDEDEIMEFGDGVDFIDDEEAAELEAEMNRHGFDDFDDFGEVAEAPSGESEFDDFNSVDSLDQTGAYEETSAFDSNLDTDFAAAAPAASTPDKDDTISEVDVYLNYGLHGQAEELLTKAIERDPNNPEYAQKLMQTYHAQGNGDGYLDAAKNFHARFGGESNPEWAGIAAMGSELDPNEPLFQGAPAPTFDASSDIFADNDIESDQELETGAVNRAFDATNTEVQFDDSDKDDDGLNFGNPLAAAGAAVAAGAASVAAAVTPSDSLDFDSNDDETDLMDQSLDPAFAFDETDLEATGDFSQIADELAAESDDGGLDFPSFDETMAVESTSDLLEDTLAEGDELTDALTMDELEGVTGVADDLTLDLDQLSDDLDLDTAELMNPDISDLELPDLSVSDSLDADDLAASAASNDSDAMETMLDLAKAYIDMGDKDSASSALDEIVKSGNPAQVTEAETLLRKIS